MKRKSLLCVIVAAVMLFGCLASGCKHEPEGPIEYTVTFDVGSNAANEGVSAPESQKVEKGGKAVQPTIDAWEGHELIGWYNGSKQWDFSADVVNSDLTLKAEWQTDVDSEIAMKYEQELTWGEENHLYVHYLRGAHSESE